MINHALDTLYNTKLNGWADGLKAAWGDGWE